MLYSTNNKQAGKLLLWSRKGPMSTQRYSILNDMSKPISFFSDLSAEERDLIYSRCSEVTVKKGSVILHQEEESFDLYIILAGKVTVSLIHEDGRTVVLDSLQEGDFFGELSVLDRRTRSAMVKAITDVKMLFLPRDKFLRILRENAEIAINLLAVMATRLRKANESIETLTFLDVAGRVSKLILDLARDSNGLRQEDNIKIQCPTHQEIADRIGASREAVTKAFKSLVSNGLITIRGRELVLSPKQFEIL